MTERTVAAQYAMCRTWQHAWDYTSVERQGGEYVQGLRCIRCGTERFVKVDARTGDRGGNRYVYPEDQDRNAVPYKMPKGTGGALSVDERAAIRLEEVKVHYAAIRDELARRRRKA